MTALVAEYEIAGFPAGWTQAEQDAQPAWWLAGYRAYFAGKQRHERQQLQLAQAGGKG